MHKYIKRYNRMIDTNSNDDDKISECITSMICSP